MPKRPEISSIHDGVELKRWYWRKRELVARARQLGLPTSGAKFVLLDRIGLYLDTGEKAPPTARRRKQTSSFDWRTEQLTLATAITDSYRNTQNVRAFFQCDLGAQFRFSIPFMEWIKSNPGKTLEEACDAYKFIQHQSRESGFRKEIKVHNQFNQYARDFMAANPEMGMREVRKCWSLKTELPSENGRHVYDVSDLGLLPSDVSNTCDSSAND